jgi:hypothetical protein
MKKGTIETGHFEFTNETKNFLFFEKSWITDPDNYTKFLGSGNWNYLHDKKRNVVYFVTKKEDCAKSGVFGNFAHLEKVYEIVNTNFCYIDYLDSKNNFKETRKDFKNYETAYGWMIKSIEKTNRDYIKFY